MGDHIDLGRLDVHTLQMGDVSIVQWYTSSTTSTYRDGGLRDLVARCRLGADIALQAVGEVLEHG